MFKKYLSIVMLLVVSFNSTGILIVLKIEQAYIRHTLKQQIKAGIPEHELHFFRFSELEYQQLEWVKPDKEFRLGSRMYDVVRTAKSAGFISLHCVNDQEEAVLFAKLDNIIQKKTEQESQTPNSPLNKAFKFLKLVYVAQEPIVALLTPSSLPSCSFGEAASFYFPPFLERLSPPPNLA